MSHPLRVTCVPLSLLLLVLFCIPASSHAEEPKTLRIGIIGLDTSHSSNFSQILNDPDSKYEEFKHCKVVAAYPQGSRSIKESLESVPEITEAVKKQGVEIVPSIEALLEKVDAVLLESNDGRVHLEQALPVLKAGKPLFVDKPIAGDLTDVIAIYEAAEHFKTPVLSSSSLRYTDGAKQINGGVIGEIIGCDAYSPCPVESTHPDFYWYGIHGVETLYTIMGPGCETVVRVHTPETDLAVGTWKTGRIGTFRGRRKADNGYQGGYGGTAFGTKGIAQIGSFSGYEPLLVEVVKFFRTGKAPVTPAESIEIYTFMSAADLSRQKAGTPVKLADVKNQAREAAKKKLAPYLPSP